MPFNLVNCLYAKDIKVKDIRAFMKKHDLDIKGRSRADLCHGLRDMYRVKPARVRKISKRQSRRIRKGCMRISMKAARATVKTYKYPVKARSKKDLCKSLGQYSRTRPRRLVSRARAYCKYYKKSRTSNILKRSPKIGGKPLEKLITARTKPTLCKRLNETGF